LNVDFNGLSLDFLGSRKPAHEGIKEWYLCKSCYFSIYVVVVVVVRSKLSGSSARSLCAGHNCSASAQRHQSKLSFHCSVCCASTWSPVIVV